MSAKEIVAAGKRAGVVLSEGHVYTIRSAAKQKGNKKAPKASAPTKAKGAGAKPKAPAKAKAAAAKAKKASGSRGKRAAKPAVGAARAPQRTSAPPSIASLASLDLAYAVGRLVESGKTTPAEVMSLAAERTARISSLALELAALRGGQVPSGEAPAAKVAPPRPPKPTGAGPAKAKGPKKPGTVTTRKDGRTFTTTAKVVTARKLQGQYMGYLRQFPDQEKAHFKAIAHSQGVPAALAELKKRLGKS